MSKTNQKYTAIFEQQRAFFNSGATRDLNFRIKKLKQLKSIIKKHEKALSDALYTDMHKPKTEAFLSETGLVYSEISHASKQLKWWARPKSSFAPMSLFYSRSKVYYEPKGLTLILGPWNYPFQLIMAPLVASIAAGNCVLVKSTWQTPATSAITKKIIEETFDRGHVDILEIPDEDIIPQLIEPHPFNHIFFTGSIRVGKIIMKAAAEQLCPVTLELGGKSPCIVDETADLKIAAKRIAWGKAFNTGQTCIAPDYILVKASVKDQLIPLMSQYFKDHFGDHEGRENNLGRIINEKRFDAITELMQEGKIVYGGHSNKDELMIEPTIIDQVSMEDKIMQEEIFGPLMPVLTWESVDDIKKIIAQNPNPLALYVFTKDKALEKELIHTTAFGGGCVNNTLVQFSDSGIPFGGFQQSGAGNYHGRYGFETFSHKKSIIKTSFRPDIFLRYPPYTDGKLKIAKWFFK